MKKINLKHRGFTLIELVVVIVILGVLAAFAVPRFADLGTEARTAALDGAKGAVLSAATLANSLQKVQSLAANASVSMEGNTVTMESGYPTANSAGIKNAVRVDGFTVSSDDGDFILASAPTPANCKITYSITSDVPAVSSTTTGC